MGHKQISVLLKIHVEMVGNYTFNLRQNDQFCPFSEKCQLVGVQIAV